MYVKLPPRRGKSVGSTEGSQCQAFEAACREIHSPLGKLREEKDYQSKLGTLLAEVRRTSDVPSIFDVDLMVFVEDLGLLYFIDNCAYQSRKFYFKALIRGHQSLLGDGRMLSSLVCAILRDPVATVFFPSGGGSRKFSARRSSQCFWSFRVISG